MRHPVSHTHFPLVIFNSCLLTLSDSWPSHVYLQVLTTYTVDFTVDFPIVPLGTHMVSLVVLAVFLLWETPRTAAFKPLFSAGSFTHRDITRAAILRKTAEVCRDIATAQGQHFTLTVRTNLSLYLYLIRVNILCRIW